MDGIEFASKEDEERFNKLVLIRSNARILMEKIDKEIAEITRRAEWTLEAIMRREG